MMIMMMMIMMMMMMIIIIITAIRELHFPLLTYSFIINWRSQEIQKEL